MKLTVLLVLLASPALAADFQEGMRLKKAEKFAEAAAVFESLAAADPKNADALEQLATMQGWLGRYDASIKTWEAALALRPDSADDRLGLARVFYWKGARERSLAQLDAILARAPENAEALALKRDVLKTAPPLRFRLDVGYTHDRFTNFRHSEYSGYGQIGYKFDDVNNVWARLDTIRQFESVDNQTTLGGAAKPWRRLLVLPSVSFTPSPGFRPEYLISLGLEAPFQIATPLFEYRLMHYAAGNVTMLIPGFRLQFAPSFNVEYRHTASRNIDKTNTAADAVRLNVFAGDFAPYIAYSDGNENLPPQSSAKVSYLTLGCSWDVTRTWGVRADYSHEHRKLFYKHDSYGVGATYRF